MAGRNICAKRNPKKKLMQKKGRILVSNQSNYNSAKLER